MIVKASQVGKRFGDVVALDSIDLEIDAGEIVGIIGPSGSGKTTAIRLILGLYEPTNGDVRVFGRQSEDFDRELRERIGYLPQHFLLYEDLTVRENLMFTAGMYGLGPRERRARIPELLEAVQLTEAQDRLAANISGGMQRRLALAGALIHDPELVVLDEPTAGIDPVLRATIWDGFRELKAHGAALLITTQYVTEAEYCDRVYLINQGRVAASGAPEELRRMVFGGDLVRFRITDLDQRLLTTLIETPLVISGSRTGSEEIELVVERAGEAIPQLSAAISELGYQVVEIEERQTSFDNIFVHLVEQSVEHDTQPV